MGNDLCGNAIAKKSGKSTKQISEQWTVVTQTAPQWKRTSGVTELASSASLEHRMGATVSRSVKGMVYTDLKTYDGHTQIQNPHDPKAVTVANATLSG